MEVIKDSPKLVLQGTIILVALLATFGGKMGGTKINMGHLIALVVSILIYRQLRQQRQNQYSQFQSTMDEQLAKLDPENEFPYLLTDPTLLNLLYVALPLRDSSEETFLSLIASCNAYLQTEAAIRNPATMNSAGEYPALLKAAGLILNRFHALVYNPQLEAASSSYKALYDTTLDEIRIHLNNKTSALRTLIVKKQREQPIDLNTIFLPSRTAPRPFDDAVNSVVVERNFQFFDDP